MLAWIMALPWLKARRRMDHLCKQYAFLRDDRTESRIEEFLLTVLAGSPHQWA